MKIYYEYDITGDEIADKFINLLYEKYKYQIMWELRHYEEEIKKDGGQIIIENKGGNARILLKDFRNKELVEKIKPLLQTIKIEHFKSML